MKLDSPSSRAARAQISLNRALATLTGACRYCGRREHLRRTARIALVVGLLLTAINQGGLILSDRATAATAVRCVLNFVVPFVVSNLGLLGARPRGETDRDER